MTTKSPAYRSELFRQALLVVCREHRFALEVTRDNALEMRPCGIEDEHVVLVAAELDAATMNAMDRKVLAEIEAENARMEEDGDAVD